MSFHCSLACIISYGKSIVILMFFLNILCLLGVRREADFKIATLLWVFRNLILSYCKFLCNYSAWSLLASCTFGFIIFIEFWAYSLDIFLSHFSLIFLPNPFRASIMWILDWLLDIVPHVTEVLFTFFILFFPLF